MRRRTFIHTMMIGSGTVFIGSGFRDSSKDTAIRVRMIYNNIGTGADLSSKWGLSMLIENDEETTLFDTGGESEVLWENMQKLDIDIEKISNVVISHNHWDHVNGLSTIIKKCNNNPKVYVPEFELKNIKSKFPGANYIAVHEPAKINENVWTSGQLTGAYKDIPIYEQSIIVLQNEDAYLFTGCSHPGIVNIVEKTRAIFPDKTLRFIAGGFHLNRHRVDQIQDISDKLKELKVKKIGPSHCTGDAALKIFKKEWKENFIDFDLAQNQVSI